MTFEVLVVGGGPAGLAMADACSTLGLEVACLLPSAEETWPNNYGAWVEDFVPLDLQHTFSRTWSKAAVHVDGDRSFDLQRPYGRVDNEKLRGVLMARLSERGVAMSYGFAASIAHEPGRSTVTCRDGRQLSAALVIDATGHKPALLDRPRGQPMGWQTAYGIEIEVASHDLDPDTMVFMDFRDPMENPPERCPTFLYAMPLGPNRLFLEETSLVSHRAPPFEFLRDRLELRLERMGIEPLRELEREHCLIPMGSPLPKVPQRIVGYGGAASMVHPATGYMLGRILKVAPRVAGAIARGLRAPAGGPERAAREAWEAVWSEDALASRELFLFGAKAIERLGLTPTREFFASFFSTPQSAWSAYLEGESPPAEVVAAMGQLFLAADNRLRGSLIASSMNTRSIHLLRSFAGL